MGLVLKQQPYNYSFSKNNLLWRFHTTDGALDGFFVQVILKAYKINSTDAPLEFTAKLPADAGGFANFYLQDIVDSMIDYEYPGTDMINVAQNIKKFKLQYRWISDVYTSNPYTTIATDFYIIKGGIETSKHDYNNYFANYHGVNKPFATWMPANGFVGLMDDFYISLLFTNNFTTPDTDARMLRVIAEWTDSTTDTIDINFPAVTGLYLLYHLKSGPEALGINALAAGRKLYRYKLQVVNVTTPSTLYTEVYVFYIDYRSFYKTKLFTYFNSLGGIDYVRINGDTEEDYNRTYSEAETLKGFIDVSSRPDTLYTQTQITRYNSFKSDAGYRHVANQAIYLQELLMSTFIWVMINAYAVRVWLLNKGNKLVQNSDTKFNFPIEWRYGFTEQVFTPTEVDFGIGDSFYGMTCPASVGTTNEDQTGGIWRLACDADIAEAIGYIFEYKLSTDTVWTIVISSISHVDIPVDAGVTYNWRVKIKCDENFYSTYTNGADFTT